MKRKSVYIIPLISLVVIFIGLWNGADWLKFDYLQDVSVEVLGAIITIIFIDIYLRRHEKIIANKREKIVWQLLKPLLRSHFSLLFTIYKASTLERGENFSTKNLKKFFSEDYIQTISNLNITLKAPIHPEQSWLTYLPLEFEKLNHQYDKLLDRYSINLEPELVEAIENIKNSRFHLFLNNHLQITSSFLLNQNGSLPKNLFEQLFDMEHVLIPYLNSINNLLDLILREKTMQDFFNIDDQYWRNDISPSIGSSRI